MTESKFRFTLPLTDETIEGLRIGDHVEFSGVIYTARDAAHKRLVAMADAGEELPLDLRGQVIYYVGPTPARPGAGHRRRRPDDGDAARSVHAAHAGARGEGDDWKGRTRCRGARGDPARATPSTASRWGARGRS